MTKQNHRIRTVDGLRGVAALLVVFDHTVDDDWGLTAWTMQNHGITVFALLTGFLLSSRFLRSRLDRRSRPPLFAFLRTRAARIYPGYWIALAGAAALIGLENMGSGDLWRVLTLTQTFDGGTPFEGLPTAWSLSLFLSFYLALPAWAWWRSRFDRPDRDESFLLRREVACLLGVVCAAWVVRTLSLTGSVAQEPAFTLLGRADWFALGMILAAITLANARGLAPRRALMLGRRPGLASLAVLALVVANGFLPIHLEELRGQLDTVAAALLVGAAVLHGPVLRGPQRWLASRPARALGRWSYGIFLWGYIVQEAITQADPTIGTGLHLVLTLAGAVVLGAASWRWVEQPAARRLQRRAEQGSKDPVPTTSAPRTRWAFSMLPSIRTLGSPADR